MWLPISNVVLAASILFLFSPVPRQRCTEHAKVCQQSVRLFTKSKDETAKKKKKKKKEKNSLLPFFELYLLPLQNLLSSMPRPTDAARVAFASCC
ncbi:hypothetical protein QG37_03078 [Candidozyma auris]|nr:hypothetical protein QG37_03078 [[Candida] auris]